MRGKNIANNVYGELTALSQAEKSANGDFYWNCSCSCGNAFKTTIGRLNFGAATSCGCKTFEKMGNAHATHRMSKTKEYKSWAKIKERIFSHSCADYKDYGAVDLTMQPEWVNNFQAFLSHIGKMPTDDRYTVNRLDNNLGYVEGNVEWATDKAQARNKGRSRNNSSGTTGVLWDLKVNGSWSNTYAKVIWNDPETGASRNKIFAVKTYGLLPAFALACAFRESKLVELNKMGAGYSASHGK